MSADTTYLAADLDGDGQVEIVAHAGPPGGGAPPASSARSRARARQGRRQGLTGAERLLQDVYALDQYAFRTDQRKLQLRKTSSVSTLDPFAFERFRQTGVLRLATPESLFDRERPGEYLRLVKRVRTSILALVPPGQGIQATLATAGTSRVVIGATRSRRSSSNAARRRSGSRRRST